MRHRPVPIPKPRQLGEIQVVLGFSGFFALMYGVGGVVLALTTGPSSDRPIAVPLMALMGLVPGCTFIGLFRGRSWGWVLGVVTFGLLLLLSLAGFLIALLAQMSGTADSSFSDSAVALFASLVFAFLFGTPLYLLIRCRKRYFSLAPKV